MLANTCLLNYTLAASFSREHILKGGVAIFYANGLDIEVESLNVESLSVPLVCEVAAVKISWSNRKDNLHILGTYLPPSNSLEKTSEAFEVLSGALESLSEKDSTVVLVGDINIDDLKSSRQKSEFNELLAEYGMARIPLPPTRISSTSSTSIDTVCSSVRLLPDITVQVLQTGISDHTGQFSKVNFKVASAKPTSSFRRHLNIENLSSLKAYLSCESWETVYDACDVESSYNSFIGIISTALDATCPLKKSRNRNSKRKFHAYDEETRRLKTQFLEAQESYLFSGRQADRRLASDLKKLYDIKLKQLRKDANAKLIQKAENKSQAIWKSINLERTQKDSGHMTHKLRIDGKLVTEPEALANHFNEYFSTIADITLNEKHIINSHKVHVQPPEVVFSLSSLSLTDVNELSDIIRKLKPKRSAGLDGISSQILKHCSEALIPPLVHITNLSFRLGEFPSKLKVSRVVPLHKKGPREDVGNFRPISLISIFSKVIEKIVLRRIFDHMSLNHLQTDRQHGFLSRRSTLTALTDVVEHIIDLIEGNDSVTGIFLDMSKAFDCLGHNMILEKLSLLGFRDTALRWVSNYLQGRKQLVELDDVRNNCNSKIRSCLLPLSRGVPQGSVLGPILFILFTNDLPGFLNNYCYTVMYADDSVLLTPGSSAESLEIGSLVALGYAEDYCNSNDLIFNESKTRQLTFGSRRDETAPLPDLLAVNSTKHLGVVLDDRLSWQDHLDHLCRKLSSSLFALKRVRSTCTQEAVLAAYYALFESHLRYGVAVWGSAAHTHLERVLIIQKKAIRIMFGMGWRDSCRESFRAHNLLTVISLYIVDSIVLASTRSLKRNEQVHQYGTRNGLNYNLPAHHLSLYERKPTYAGARFFNNLPQELKDGNPTTLKRKLVSWFSKMPFYSVREYMDWQHFG